MRKCQRGMGLRFDKKNEQTKPTGTAQHTSANRLRRSAAKPRGVVSVPPEEGTDSGRTPDIAPTVHSRRPNPFPTSGMSMGIWMMQASAPAPGQEIG